MSDQYRYRAEALLRDPPLLGAMGALRLAVVELQREAEAALIDADARLRSAAQDRLDAVERLERCQRALLGTGQIVGETLSVSELHRLLVAHGVGVGGRASQSISGALRVEVSRGRVDRVGWGQYRAASLRRG
jgi:hypothetical protein